MKGLLCTSLGLLLVLVAAGSLSAADRLVGDANNDGIVDLLDLSVLAANWDSAVGGGDDDGDFDGNGAVGLEDLSLLAANWGRRLAPTYYVDATGGNDSADGKSPETAWKSVWKLQTSTFNPGDTILFKRGETWNGRLDFFHSGQEGQPITLGAYGEGDMPTLRSGYESPKSDWTDLGDGRYSITYASYISVTFAIEDDNLIPHATSAALTDGNWYWDDLAKTLYYKPTSGTLQDHRVYRCNQWVLDISNQSYINISDLRITLCSNGIWGRTTTAAMTNISITNCEFSKSAYGVSFNAINGYDNSDITISDNTFRNHKVSISFSANNGAGRHNNCTIANNTLTDSGFTVGDERWDEFAGPDYDGIGTQNLNDSVISGNTLINGCPTGGFLVWVQADSQAKGNTITYNYLKNLIGPGITYGSSFSTTGGTTIAYNIVIGCGQAEYTYGNGIGGLRLNKDQSPITTVYNNLLIGNDINIYLFGGTDFYTLKNNISYNPVKHHVRRDGLIGSNVLDYNCYYPDSATALNLNGVNHTLATWKTATSQDANSFADDPLFVSAAVGDYHLQAGSPCIDAGTDVGLTRDHAGSAVPAGTAPDVGAYEKQ